MRVPLLAVAATLFLASPAAAAPTWLPPQSFETGLTADPPGADVAVTPNGTAIAAWVARVGGVDLARARVRLPGQGFGPTINLTPADGRDAFGIHVASDAQGNATLAWEEENGPGGVHLIRATRIAAGSVAAEPAQTVSLPAAASTLPAIGVGANGVAVIAYTEGGPTRVLRAVTRNGPAGDFGPTTSVSGLFDTGNANPVVGVADDGSAVIAWQRIIAAMPSVIEANDRAPNGDFGNPMTDAQEISNPITAATNPALAIAPDGTTVVLWSQATTNDVRYNERTPAGTWLSDPKVASKTGQTGFAPAVGMDGAGNAIAAWIATEGATSFLQAATRPPGGTFGNHRDLTSTSGGNLRVAVNRRGDSVITFNGPMAELIGSVVRSRGGNFSGVIPAETRATATTALRNEGLGIDDEGNASAIWTRNIVNPGATWDVATGTLDAAPPTLTASVPPGGTAGQAIGMAAAAIDRLTPVGIHWNFGDGGTASGGAVTHAFGTPGAFNVTVTATDGVGNAASATRPVLVAAAPKKPKKRITSPISVTWGVSGKRIFLLKLTIRRALKGTKAELRCSRRKSSKCPFKRVSSKKRRKGTITLFKEISASKVVGKKKRSFMAGQRLELRITKKGFIGKVARYDLKKGKIPSAKDRCLPPGAKKPRKRC